MQEQQFYIKGMVCDRCISAVRQVMTRLGITVTKIQLGQVTLAHAAGVPVDLIEEQLLPLGFALLQEKKNRLIQEIKTWVSEVYSGNFDFPVTFRFSHFVSKKMNTRYETISDTFSSAEQYGLEKYIIGYRINRACEKLAYTGQTVSGIASSLGFSSVAHLSRQFKQHTGLTPSHFRNIRRAREYEQLTGAGS